jgi:RTX calcium-binding nonapeptide repeat (4 copies)
VGSLRKIPRCFQPTISTSATHACDGDDDIHGDQGDDVLWGDAGDDALDGAARADTIDGDDTLRGGSRDDRLTEGAGSDDAGGDRARNTCDAELTERCVLPVADNNDDGRRALGRPRPNRRTRRPVPRHCRARPSAKLNAPAGPRPLVTSLFEAALLRRWM